MFIFIILLILKKIIIVCKYYNFSHVNPLTLILTTLVFLWSRGNPVTLPYGSCYETNNSSSLLDCILNSIKFRLMFKTQPKQKEKGSIYASRSIKRGINRTTMKPWHHMKTRNETTQGGNANHWYTANTQFTWELLWIMYLHLEVERCSLCRCVFDMHRWHTINISGPGWRLPVPLVSFAYDCNRWSSPFFFPLAPRPHSPSVVPHRCQTPPPSFLLILHR